MKSQYDVVILGAGHNWLVAVYYLSRLLAEQVWDTMLEPLVAKEELRRRFDVDDVSREAWRRLAEETLGNEIERHLQNDLLFFFFNNAATTEIFTFPHHSSLPY